MITSGWTVDDMAPMRGRTVVITGANSGLGLASSIQMARHGATVVLACRNPDRAAAALDTVRAAATGSEPITVTLDLADLDSVGRAADRLAATLDSVDVLMNNAGLMAPPLGRTAQGHELQFGINHLGHFALTNRLLPLLLAAPAPRVVTTSSGAHRLGRMRWEDLDWRTAYRKWPAYAQSKLANLLFSFELDRRAVSNGSPLKSIAAHPGYAATHLQAAGAEAAGSRTMATVMSLGNSLLAQSADDGALPQLFAASDDAAVGGAFYGPDRLAQMRGAPTAVRPAKAALDERDGERLWDRSVQLTGTDAQWAN